MQPSSLLAQNPWWQDVEAIDRDVKVTEWENASLKFIPRLSMTIKYDFSPDNTVVYTLRGPRQSGKTTLMKLQIRSFLKRGVQPWNIFYYSLHMDTTKADVVDVVEMYSKLASRHWNNSRRYMFLDEAEFIPNWQKGIKWLVDQGRIKNSTVVIGGSNVIDLKNAAERMPGRRGKIDDKNNYDKVLLPAKFSEYVTTIDNGMREIVEGRNLLSLDVRKKIFFSLANHEIAEEIDLLNSYKYKLNQLLDDYLLTGGMPHIVNEWHSTGIISEKTFANHWSSITGEFGYFGKNEAFLLSTGTAMARSLGSRISWNGLAKGTDIGSVSTLQEYAFMLRDLFVIYIIRQYGEKRKIARGSKNKKFYFSDPFFAHLFNFKQSSKNRMAAALDYLHDDNSEGRMVEQAVADHLIRWAFNTSASKQSFDYNKHVFYWTDGKGRETDFVFYDGKIKVPIEAKFKNKINPRELASMIDFLDETGGSSGIVLSKDYLEEKRDYLVVPASIFLMLI